MEHSVLTRQEEVIPDHTDLRIPMQTASWLAARAKLDFPGTPRVFTVERDGQRRATAMLCQTKFGLREMPLMNEPSDFAWSDEADLRKLVRQIIGARKPIYLERLPAHSPTLSELKQAAKGRFWLHVEPGAPTPYLDTRCKTINDLVNRGRRSDLRRAGRKLEKSGTVTYEMRAATSKEDLAQLIDEAIDVEGRSWKEEMGTALTSPDEATYAAAFREFLEEGHDEGHIRFAFLRLDGRAIAMQIASEWNDRWWIYKATFDKDFSKSSPGNLLYFHTLEQVAEKGLLSYEFMGKMDKWTSAWTKAPRDYVMVFALPYNLSGVKGLIAIRGWMGKEWTRARIREAFGLRSNRG